MSSFPANDCKIYIIQLIDIKNRKVVDFLLTRMKKFIDVLIPRGGKNLVKKVQKLSNLPVIGHLEGVCHTYVDKNANLNTAKKIIFNAKLRNTAICGATETILVHQKILKKSCNIILKHLEDHGCKIIGDNRVKKNYKGKIIWDKAKPDGTPRKLLDSSKVNALRWQPKIKLQEGIRKTIKEIYETNLYKEWV